MPDDRPTEAHDYAALNAVWGAALAGLLAGTDDEAPPYAELPVFALATFALTKALAKEKVGTWVREPVVDEDESRHPRGPKGRGLRYAVGELVTCTRCLGTWSSLGLVGLRVARPREGRIVAGVLATAGMNDWLQSGFGWLCAHANAAARLGDRPLEEWPAARQPRFTHGDGG